MAGYSLKASYQTVQVLSPTVVNDIQYCTIQTSPSGVIASMPVQLSTFQQDQANVDLGNFADAIEQTMALPSVTAGAGSQSLDASGLLADEVTFTVEYPASAAGSSNITTQVSIPVGELNFTDALIGQTLWEDVQNKIAAAYANLQSAAGG